MKSSSSATTLSDPRIRTSHQGTRLNLKAIKLARDAIGSGGIIEPLILFQLARMPVE
jgi:hypothetical protein